MFTNIVLILGGFILLIKGADYLVEGSSSLAKKFGMSSLMVGLTVVAFGTSAPEFFVNVIAAFGGATDLAIGNVFGSNIANILLVLGVASLFAPLSLQSNTVWKEIPFSLLAAVMVVVMGSDNLLDKGAMDVLSRSDGLVLLGFFVIFIVYTFGLRTNGEQPEEKVRQLPFSKSVMYTLGGLGVLAVGGDFVVSGASEIARMFGVTQNLIALTIVAIGTSLPELVASIIAAKKGHVNLAIGNVVGSSIFNLLFVLSSTAIVAPVVMTQANIVDGFMVILTTLILFSTLFIGFGAKRRGHVIDRREGMLMIGVYFSYILFAIIRG